MESTGDECMDEFLLVFLGEKTFNSVDVSELVKSCLGDSFDVAAESQKFLHSLFSEAFKD